MAAPAPVDPTKPGKYPVILSDELLGKTSKESFTGIRYNHRPALSSETAPSTARLKKSAAKDGSYNLGFDDNGDRYQYNGVRTTSDGNYVLIFEPARQAFVLHRVDSMFHMNLTKAPTDGVENLRKKFPQLEVNNSSAPSKQPSKQSKGKDTQTAARDKAKPPAAAKGKAKDTKAAPKEPAAKGKKAKQEKPAPKPVELSLPTAAPPQKVPLPVPPKAEENKFKRRARSPVESEDDDDDDGGLIVEFPDGKPSTSFQSFSPAFPPFPTERRFSQFVGSGGHEEDDEDADAEGEDELIEDEEEDEEMEDVKLPSPINQPVITEPERFEFETSADAEGEEFEDDLDAELEKEFMMANNELDAGHDSDSSMSEEE